MNPRTAIEAWSDEHRLDASTRRRLEALAGIGREPAALERVLPQGLAVLAAALLGLGLVLWIAANWQALGRFGRFTLVEATLVATCLGAMARPALRAPLALLAFLAIGGLLAVFGQNYQTGADAWQLFALWALLSLPLALGTRSDVVWAPWALVAMVGTSLWIYAQAGHRWWDRPDNVTPLLIGWAVALAIMVMLARPSRKFTGAGDWALRTAVTLAVVMIAFTALANLFGRDGSPPAMVALVALLALGAIGAAFAGPRSFDVFTLSAAMLGLDTVVVAGLTSLMFSGHSSDWFGSLLLIGLVAAGLLAASVSLVLHLSKRHAAQPQGAAS